jgi:hypothetical protein
MKMSKGNYLCKYFKQTKMLFFFFFIYKYQRTGGQNRSCLRAWYQLERGGGEEGM